MHACAIANSALLLMEKRMYSCTYLINRFNCRPRPHHPLLSVGAAAASKTSVSTARLSQAVYSMSMSACVALCPRSRSTQPLLPDTGTTSDFIAAALQLARAMRAPAFGSLNPSSAGTSSAVDAPDSPFILADDDVAVTASSDPSADFPHARHNCRIAGMSFIPVQYMPRVHHKAPEASVRLNKKHCPNCFCYVCDVEASKCKEWELHCCADDQPRGYPVSLPAFAVA